MTPDRRSIEKKDFPLSRRGYERTAVHAHLREVAGWLEEERTKPETLATTASEHVRAIVGAAEESAAEIRRRSEVKANSELETAKRDAERVRVDAAGQAEDYLAKVKAAATGMLDQVSAIEDELGSLLGSVRARGERLGGELEELTRELGTLSNVSERSAEEATEDRYSAVSEEDETPEIEDVIDGEIDNVIDGEIDNVYDIGDGLAARDSAPELRSADATLEAASVVETADQPYDEEQRARLVALDMALGGTPREEADRFLAATYRLENRQILLDEIYERVSRGGQ